MTKPSRRNFSAEQETPESMVKTDWLDCLRAVEAERDALGARDA